MKKIISIVLVLLLFLCCCTDLDDNTSVESFVSEIKHTTSEATVSVESSSEQKSEQDKNIVSKQESSVNSPKINSTSKVSSKKEVSSQKQPEAVKIQSPEVKFSTKDSNVKFADMVNLSNGGFAVAGVRNTHDNILSIIQTYDKNSNFVKEYTFKNGNGFDKIAVCSDGGFIAASYCPPYLTKISSDFGVEWVAPYEDIVFEGRVHDIEEISPDLIAVLFVSLNSPDFSRRLKISYLDRNGELIETVDLMKNTDPQDADIIADGNGGFYLLSACNESLADKFSLVAENYDSLKATEAIVMHFSKDRELIWSKTLGGGGNDWIEEATMDNSGNIYLAVGTDWNGADSFWEMSVDSWYLYRRMLVKLDKNGDIVYKVPLSNKGMAVDQVFGIHIKDGKAYVIGMSDYFDGYQAKYPCEQILPSEKGNRVFCVYNACIDSNGKELDRKIFRCDINNKPCDSVLLPNGSLVIAGSVSAVENPFNLEFPSGMDSSASLFIFKD